MDEVRRMIEELRFKSHDYCINHNNPRFQEFDRAVEDLLGHIKEHETADKLEWKIKDFEQTIRGLKQDEEVFKYQDTDDLYDRSEDIRKLIEKLAQQ